MNLKTKFFSILLLITIFGAQTACNSKQNSTLLVEAQADNQEIDPYEFFEYPAQAYTNFYTGEITPDGWIEFQMQKDLNGFISQMDDLAPQVLTQDDIYGKNRRTDTTQGTEVSPNALSWWNSESQSNWRDGFIRSAILLEDREYLKEVDSYVRNKFSTQDENGYLGIYGEDLRFLEDGENADLWAQASLLRGLLAYYEFTRDPQILARITDAVDLTMQAYPVDLSTPFKKLEVGHSLIFTDILDRLFQITGNRSYLNYSLWLLKDYNKHRNIPENYLAPDILLVNTLNDAYRFKGHGVHTYELFRSLITAYYASGNRVLKKAIDDYLEKIAFVESPSGGPAGDEWIGEREADASEVGYEYCSIHELLDSYTFLLQKNGDLKLADKVEWLLYNAGQGARHPDGNSIAYCKSDNSYSMLGGLHGSGEELRYKYSPVHQDVAVCCAPNAGRIYPYYVKSMWLRQSNGILAALFGPSTLNTEINGVKVNIQQITNYPFDHNILFIVNPQEPVRFRFSVRKPEWAETLKVNGFRIPNAEIEKQAFSIEKEWKPGDTLKISFDTQVIIKKDNKGDSFLAYGPLAFALPIEADETLHRNYGVSGFKDTFYAPTVEGTPVYTFPNTPEFILEKEKYDARNPWEFLSLKGMLYNPKKSASESVILKPMGGTLLRQLTFRNQ